MMNENQIKMAEKVSKILGVTTQQVKNYPLERIIKELVLIIETNVQLPEAEVTQCRKS